MSCTSILDFPKKENQREASVATLSKPWYESVDSRADQNAYFCSQTSHLKLLYPKIQSSYRIMKTLSMLQSKLLKN